jgi:hypothetical protein
MTTDEAPLKSAQPTLCARGLSFDTAPNRSDDVRALHLANRCKRNCTCAVAAQQIYGVTFAFRRRKFYGFLRAKSDNFCTQFLRAPRSFSTLRIVERHRRHRPILSGQQLSKLG